MITKCKHISDFDLLDQDVIVSSGLKNYIPWSRSISYGWITLDYSDMWDDVQDRYQLCSSEYPEYLFYDYDKNGFCIPELDLVHQRNLTIETIFSSEETDHSNKIKNYWPQ